MEIRGRHDISRACGLLLSVDCAQNVPETSALLLAGFDFDMAPCIVLVLLYL